jgi:hypothetical protein
VIAMKIINATRVDSKFHAHVVLEDGSVWTEIYRDIRGSFVWPTMLSPGYRQVYAGSGNGAGVGIRSGNGQLQEGIEIECR